MVKEDTKLEYDILNHISQAKLPIGASLLALEIHASQATIGRKLQELEFQGYLKKISNKGRIITEKGREYLRKLENEIIQSQKANELIEETKLSKKRLLDILHVRKILERETVMLAAEMITKDQIGKLKSLVNLQAYKLSQGQLGDEEDLEFHRTLADISGNKVIEQILTLILTQKGVYSELSYIRKKQHTTIVHDHKRILEAMERGDAQLAGELVVSHIDKIINDVHKYFESRKENESKN